MVKFEDMNAHHASTWYKNRIDFRSFRKDWSSPNFDYAEAPELFRTVPMKAKCWSIPSQIDVRRVVAGCWDQHLHCFDPETHETVWTREVDGPVYSSPSVLADGSFVVGTEGGTLFRFDKNGTEIWRHKAGDSFHSSPTVDLDRGRVYIGSFDSHMHVVDLNTGTLIWKKQYEQKAYHDICTSAALSRNGNIIFGSYKSLFCVSPDGDVVWKKSSQSLFDGSAALCHETGLGIVGTLEEGKFYVFDIKTGEFINEVETGAYAVTSPSIGPDHIACIGADNGRYFGVSLETGNILWERNIGGHKFLYAAFTTLPTGHFMFVALDEKIHCIDPYDGGVCWSIGAPGGVHSGQLATFNGYLIAGSHRDAIHFFRWPQIG
uniref:YWTD domain protein n=1 Tax=Rhizobium rhizogenes TaxID=359 RepID=A0A7S4ZUN2_RHIRH|nr:PQQ-binding-like beta-propeller repeat protein [Rhizobium rhizogenes]QCO89388.1 YWTD domain protein [Rhizobium rhizogenes]